LEAQFGVKLFGSRARSVAIDARTASAISRKSQARWQRCSKPDGEMLRHRRDRGGRALIRRTTLLHQHGADPGAGDFKRRNPGLILRVEATTINMPTSQLTVDVAIRYAASIHDRPQIRALIEVRGLPVCAACADQRRPAQAGDLSRQVLIHLTSQPRAWPALAQAGRDFGNDPARSALAR